MRNLVVGRLLLLCAAIASLVNAQLNFPDSNSNNNQGRQTQSSSSNNRRSFISNQPPVQQSITFSSSQQQQRPPSSSGRGSGGGSSCCKPASKCASTLFSSSERSRSSCSFPEGGFGVCCNAQGSRGSSKSPFQSADEINIGLRTSVRLQPNQISVDIRKAQSFVNNATAFSFRFGSPSRNTGAFYHARFQKQARRNTREQGRSGLILEEIARLLSNNYDIDTRRIGGEGSGRRGNLDAVNFGPNVQTKESLGSEGCPSKPFCSATRYRSADGSCNNLRQGNWGKSDTVFNRILLPEYADGIELPRISVTGAELPSPRLLSTSLAKDRDSEDAEVSAFVMSFGQFIDHDITHSPILSRSDGGDIDCCSSSSGDDFENFCLPISIPRSDRFFRGRKTCMNFVRSTPGPALDCSIRYREQINQLTHWLDLSQVYGPTTMEQRDVREFRGGRLRINDGPNGDLLPVDNTETCKAGACMKAGDGRVNEQPNLGIMHILFLREHNRIVGILQSLNPSWSDEQLFQEGRKILIGKYQHIVYNEWLPIILGRQFMNTYGLLPLSNGYSNDYDPTIDPRITNEFATAAFRFGHSLIPGFIQVNNRIGQQVNPSFSLRESFFKPELLRLPGMIDGLVSGLTRERIQKFDSSFSEDITNHLFDGDDNGMDLVALNIQRGRDHGLPGYTKYRQLCGLGAANSFSDLSRHMSVQRTQELQQLYASPDDIDLFVGLFSERPFRDALVGPTTICILGDQFARLKKGDRFFYDLGGETGSFSRQQLEEVQGAPKSNFLCLARKSTIAIIFLQDER